MKYRREIDGLRAVAVLPVILFHAGVAGFSGGYVGVDVFFVISGYLITSIIVAETENSTFSLCDFYERRARRILPALFFVVLVCIPFAWEWMPPSQLKEFSQSVAAVSLFGSNILFWQQSGYFAPAAELKPLLHTWSLAVEEQYYIVFPLFMLVAWRFGKRVLFASLLLIAVVSLLLAQWGLADDPDASFYLLPARLWELLIGSLIAIYLFYKRPDDVAETGPATCAQQFLGFFGLALIVYSIVAFDDETPFPGLYALIPTVGTALVILCASRTTVVARLLSCQVPVGIGLISYSAYLWHQPLFAFARVRSVGEPSQALLMFLGVLSLALAFVTWKYVEQPLRDRSRFPRRQIVYYAVVGAGVVVGAGFLGHLNDGFSSRTTGSGQTYAESRFDDRVRVNHGLSRKCAWKFTLSEACRTNEQPDILVWGDSFAMHLVPGILASNQNAKIVQITKSACGPIIGLAPTNGKFPEKWAKKCLDFNNSVAHWIQGNGSLRYVVLSSLFLQFLSDDWKIVTADGVIGADESIVYKHFAATLDFLIAQGIQPVVFAPPPFAGNLFDPMDKEDIGACLVKASVFADSTAMCNFSRSSYESKQRDLVAFLKRVDQKYRVIWIDEFVCDEEVCRAAMEGTFIYRDTGHLSYEGSALVGSQMDFYGLITSPEPVD